MLLVFQKCNKMFGSLCQVQTVLSVFLLVYCTECLGITLPRNLTSQDGQWLGSYLGFQSVSRATGPASSLGMYPGIYPGVEFLVLVPPELAQVGEGGQLGAIMPIPRLVLTKGLPFDIDIAAYFLPSFVMPVYSGLGGSIKWTCITEEVAYVAIAGKVSYGFSAFARQMMTTSTWGADIIVSQDWVYFLPYGSVGWVYTSSNWDKSLLKEPGQNVFWEHGFHLCVGVEIRGPLTWTIELGLSGSHLYIGFVVGKNFYDLWPNQSHFSEDGNEG